MKAILKQFICITVACMMFGQVRADITCSSKYRSPHNATNAKRATTSLIILHTTEGSFLSAAKKLSDKGECHYLVNTDGAIYCIVDRDLIASHAGRSMWNNKENVSTFSVGIEVVGKAVSAPNAKQISALTALIKELKSKYNIPDDGVLSHAHVAYTIPNRWHKRDSRGSRTCGKLFGTWNLRSQLGLTKKPAFDPDVRAGRVAADPELRDILYAKSPKSEVTKLTTVTQSQTAIADNVITTKRTAWNIARDQYNQATTIYEFPDGKKKRGDEITDWGNIPVNTRVILSEDASENTVEPIHILGKNATSATAVARGEARSASTFYIFPVGKPYKGKVFCRGTELTTKEIASLPVGTRILVGYAKVGPITSTDTAYSFCGLNWDAKDTYYLYSNGLLKSGSEIDENKIPTGAYILHKN